MSKLIEETPEVAMLIFSLCISQNKFVTHRSYGETKVERKVSYLFFPFKRKLRKYMTIHFIIYTNFVQFVTFSLGTYLFFSNF